MCTRLDLATGRSPQASLAILRCVATSLRHFFRECSGTQMHDTALLELVGVLCPRSLRDECRYVCRWKPFQNLVAFDDDDDDRS